MKLSEIRKGMSVKIAEHTRVATRWVGTNGEETSYTRPSFEGVVDEVYEDATVVVRTEAGEYVEVDPGVVSLR